MSRQCIVIGASAGGFVVVTDIASRLPADLPVPVFLVMHIPAYQPSYLPSILNHWGTLHAIHPKDSQRIEASFIYIAPPDHHLLIDDGHIAVVRRGPKENGFHTSIDALFCSAAYSYGPATIGVVLSGALHDGTSGLWTIKRLGGTAVVRDPYDAEYASMPRSALEYVAADYKIRSADIGGLLVRLANEPLEKEEVENNTEKSLEDRIATDVQIAAGTNVSHEKILELGERTPCTCPGCHGALVRIKEGKLSRFRCHTGYGYGEDALLEAVMQSTGEMIWQVTRGLQETIMLLEHMGNHIRDLGDPARAEKRASQLQKLGTQHENLSDAKLEPPREESE